MGSASQVQNVEEGFPQSNQLAFCSYRHYNKIMKIIEVPYVPNVLAHFVLPEVAQVPKVVHLQV